ncbi:unnamed protein product, partial [Nesidiocoris tenuis]
MTYPTLMGQKSDSQSTDSSQMEVEEQCSETEAAPAAVQQVVQGNKSEPIPIEVDSGIENMEVEEVRESSRIRDLISQCLMEVMCQIASNQNPLPEPEIVPPQQEQQEEPPQDGAVPSSSTNESKPAPRLTPQSHASKTLTYLTDCYSRCAVEERCHPK